MDILCATTVQKWNKQNFLQINLYKVTQVVERIRLLEDHLGKNIVIGCPHQTCKWG